MQDFDINDIPEPTPIHALRSDNQIPQKNNHIMQMNNNLRNQMMEHNMENHPHNKELINSLTQEIMKNLEEQKLNLDEDSDNYSNKSNRSIKKHKIPDNKEMLLNIVSNKLEEDLDITPSYSKGYISMIFEDYLNYKEFLLLLAIYFLLSQEMIKDTIGMYFTSINEDDNGRVQAKGVIIYGIILAVLFIITKRLVL